MRSDACSAMQRAVAALTAASIHNVALKFYCRLRLMSSRAQADGATHDLSDESSTTAASIFDKAPPCTLDWFVANTVRRIWVVAA